VFLFFSVARSQEFGICERATEINPAAAARAAKLAKAAAIKGLPNAEFGMNMPLMSSAFDTSMWLSAA
jgi:hypothetical protein